MSRRALLIGLTAAFVGAATLGAASGAVYAGFSRLYGIGEIVIDEEVEFLGPKLVENGTRYAMAATRGGRTWLAIISLSAAKEMAPGPDGVDMDKLGRKMRELLLEGIRQHDAQPKGIEVRLVI